MVFVGRTQELKTLDNKLSSKKEELIIIYGRRRTGKTTLIKRALENKNHTYYLATQESSQKNVDSFKALLAENLDEQTIAALQANSFTELFKLVEGFIPKNYCLAIDEFPYLIQKDPSIPSQFQKIYDEYLKQKNVKLILCGSSNSIMGDLMSYQSPLYGRRTASIQLKGFSLAETKQYLQTSIEQATKYQLLFGGIPYYLEQINADKIFEENFSDMFFKAQSLFLDEPLFLLKEEYKEVTNYLSILTALAQGKNTFTHIADLTNIDKSSLSAYLKNLETIGLVAQTKSFFDKQNSKKTRYKIQDYFLHTWFKAIKPYLSQLQNKQKQQEILLMHLPSAQGILFEQLCQEILSPNYEKTGAYFREVEIDMLGQQGKNITCFEIKYKKEVNIKKEKGLLKEKIAYLPKQYAYDVRVISIDGGITLKDLYNTSKKAS